MTVEQTSAEMKRRARTRAVNRKNRLAGIERELDELGVAYSEATSYEGKRRVRERITNLGRERSRLLGRGK